MNNKEALPKYELCYQFCSFLGGGIDLDAVLITFVPAGLPSSTESRCPRAGRHGASKRPTRRRSWIDSGRRSARWDLYLTQKVNEIKENTILWLNKV